MVLVAMLLPACIQAEKVRLAVGCTHVFDRAQPCVVQELVPASAAKDLQWQGRLAIEVSAEGRAELRCGDARLALEFVSPARLELSLLGEPPAEMNTPFVARLRAFDAADHELDLGQITPVEWSVSGPIQHHADASAGEFGYCPTCFGQGEFVRVGAGTASIHAKLGDAKATFSLDEGPP